MAVEPSSIFKLRLLHQSFSQRLHQLHGSRQTVGECNRRTRHAAHRNVSKIGQLGRCRLGCCHQEHWKCRCQLAWVPSVVARTTWETQRNPIWFQCSHGCQPAGSAVDSCCPVADANAARRFGAKCNFLQHCGCRRSRISALGIDSQHASPGPKRRLQLPLLECFD